VKEIALKRTTKTTAGIRISQFTDAVVFLTEILELEMVLCNKEKEFAQFKLPSGRTMEIFGAKNLWLPFTTPPDWELIVADIRYRKE
jgi:hypothetical protein